MTNRYAIDACALIDASKNYNLKKKSFSHIWEMFNKLFEDKKLISSAEIYDEIRDEDLKAWLKQHKDRFVPLSETIQRRTKQVLAEYPELIKIRPKKAASSNGDPFLIATALEFDCTIITNEHAGDEASRDFKIPNVCKRYNIPCISLSEFLDTVLE